MRPIRVERTVPVEDLIDDNALLVLLDEQDIALGDLTVAIDVSNVQKATPGYLSGRPEHCYPAEPADYDATPTANYGCLVVSGLFLAAAHNKPLRRYLLATNIRALCSRVNDTIESWNLLEDLQQGDN